MWELTITTATSFANHTTRSWFDEESEARPYYDVLKSAMERKSTNSSDVFEIKARGGKMIIKVDDVRSVFLNDLDSDTFEKLDILNADSKAVAIAHVLQKFDAKVADLFAKYQR